MNVFYVKCGLLAFIGFWEHSALAKYASDTDSGIVLHRSLST